LSGFGKKIEFIDCYSHGIFNGNIGFVRYWITQTTLEGDVYLQNLWKQGVSHCKVFLWKTSEEKNFVTEIPVGNGRGEGYFTLPLDALADLSGLCFEWAPERTGCCRMNIAEKEDTALYMDKGDKWEQMLEKYPCFFPFEGQGAYVILQEADKGLLPAVCRRLWESDFYKKSYYGTRHMIVGEYEIEGRKAFYLGLCGTYNEEEQLSAAAAGCMGYEFSGAAGYYLYLLGECL